MEETEFDELEPMTEPYDWGEAFRQNPETLAEALGDLLAVRRIGYEPQASTPGCMTRPRKPGRMLADEVDVYLMAARPGSQADNL